jgi:poly(3-hydroxybutyrate) depolymerase
VELRARTEPDGPARLHLLPPSASTTASPLIFHLHGNGSHPDLELPNWQYAANKGWLVAAPAAQDMFWAGGNAVWPSHASAETQIAEHFSALQKDYSIDPTHILLTGFSMGGDIAIAQTLQGNLIPARGFIVVGPGGPMVDDPESYRPLIEAAHGRGLRGVIMASSADPAIELDKITRLAQLLNEGGIPCRFVFYSDEGHVYPEDFPKRLKSALAFILRDE